jgi:hypothetical protein
VNLGIVIGFNLGLSLILLWLAGWFWQWRGSLQTSEIELSIATQSTQEFLQKTILQCQQQRLFLLKTRYQYQQIQKYRQQLQQLLQLISLLSWLGSRLFPAIPRRT